MNKIDAIKKLQQHAGAVKGMGATATVENRHVEMIGRLPESAMRTVMTRVRALIEGWDYSGRLMFL